MNTIVITGASSGIGKFLYDAFKKEGYRVYGTYFSNSTVCVDENFSKVDVSDYEQVSAWIDMIKDDLQQLVLINCAGIAYNSFTHKSDIESWSRVIDINVKGSYHTIRALLPIMRADRFGRIINFSSVVAKLPTMGTSAYTCSKAALIGLTKTVAVENANFGITANSISPGYFDIGMNTNDVPEKYRLQMLEKIPSHSFGPPEDILNTVKYIVATTYLNGSDIDINGAII